jgi:tetratricopeptide (TPR) repeat protein
MIGSRLAHYEIVRHLGAGGMGEVYVAQDTKLQREVALKVLPEDLATDADRLARFEREATTVAALNHPNIVTIYSVEEANGIRFMTMELVRGQTLDALIPEGGMSVRDFLDLAVPLADAIAAAHAKGVQHRDLKPPNVMVDEEGRVKVLDFGLATQREATGPEGVTQMLTGELTGEGKIIGTISYMSPEQAEGRVLDHRSDIFSLGILLYEMLTGERPFSGDTNLSILSSILKDEPDSVSDVRDSIPFPIARLIQRSLAKQPGERYQSAADLRQDLKDIQRDLQTDEALSSGLYSGTHAAPDLRGRGPWLRRGAYAAGAVGLIAAAALMLPMLTGAPGSGSGTGAPTAPAALGGPPAVAVFYFDNISNDEELDWLRTGLTDMLVTDLSQSAGVRVLATDRLYSLLQQEGADQAAMTSFDVVQKVSAEAGMNTAVVGSYARAGDELRINIRIQDPGSGDVLASHSVLGAADAVFDLVDDITDWIESEFTIDARDTRVAAQVPGIDLPDIEGIADAAALRVAIMEDRDLREVTTQDVEAYRMYTEGVRLNLESKEDSAIPLLEAAVEKDPEFAMAHAKLSVAHGNAGDTEKAETYARRAFEMSDRLPPRERFYIQGRYLSMNPETVNEAIEAYGRAVEMFPDHLAARHNLAQQLMQLERYDEAIPHYEALRSLGHRFAPSYGQLANAYGIRGDFGKAIEVLEGFVAKNPGNAQGHVNLGEALARAGRYDEAVVALDRAYALTPNPDTLQLKVGVLGLAERWDDARALNEEMLQGTGRSAFVAHIRASAGALYFGRVDEAREYALAGLDLVAAGSPQWLWGMSTLFGIAEMLQDYDEMVRLTSEMREQGYNQRTAQQIEINDAIARAFSGDDEGAREALARFRGALDGLPIPPATRRRVDAQVDGVMAVARRDTDTAIRNLQAAVSQMPSANFDEEGMQMTFFLGEALWTNDEHERAVEHFLLITDATLGRLENPVAYVRSLWYLGTYYAEIGDRAQAEQYYTRYLGYWGDGQVDRDRVAQAREYLAG